METEYKISEADHAVLAAMDAELIEEDRVEEMKRRVVLEDLRKIVSPIIYSAIVEELNEGGYTFDYKITLQPVGTEQDDGAAWGKHFVNQTTDGGYTGDEYAGTVSIPLGDGRFFQFEYAM